MKRVLLGLAFIFAVSPVWAETSLKAHLSHQSPAIQEVGIVGLNFTIQPQTYPLIMMVYPGTPAAKTGLQPGDQVVKINNQATWGMSRHQVDQAISDVPGDQVHLLVQRQGQRFQTSLTVQSLNQIQSKPVKLFYRDLFQQP